MERYGLTTAHFSKCCRENREAHFVFIFKYVCVFVCVRACVRTHLSLAVAEITKPGRQNSFLYTPLVYTCKI